MPLAPFPPGARGACQGVTEWTPGERIWITALTPAAAAATALRVWVFSGDAAVLDLQHLIDELATTYTVSEVILDPWRAAAIGAEAEARGLVVTEFPQADVRMCRPARRSTAPWSSDA